MLFCDVVGYTELGERLDPESRARPDLAAFRPCSRRHRASRRHGREVHRRRGGGRVRRSSRPRGRCSGRSAQPSPCATRWQALDGAPGGRTRGSAGEDRGEHRRGRGGDPGDESRDRHGDAVSVGKRLESAAAPDEIVLGRETQSLVAHAVAAEPLEPLILKGKQRRGPGLQARVRRRRRDGDPAPVRLAARRPLPGARAAANRVRRGRGRRGGRLR